MPNRPDVKQHGLIRGIQAGNLGPFHTLDIRPAPRMNVLTGPNGSGKTTALDLAWWALTGEADLAERTSRQGSWAEALLAGNARKNAEADGGGAWSQTKAGEQPKNPAPYFREDGSFRVFDPGNPLLAKTRAGTPDGTPGRKPGGAMSARDLWRGQPGRTEGMRRDICRWQRAGARPPDAPDAPDALTACTAFTAAMSQAFGGEVEIMIPVRGRGNAQETPVIRVGDVTVPLDQAGAGTLRAASMAHLIAWMWEERRVQASLAGQKPGPEPGSEPGGPPTVIIDLPEAHLHLQTQRNIVRALMDLVQHLHGEEGQWLLATHSPEILTAAEPPDLRRELDRTFALPL